MYLYIYFWIRLDFKEDKLFNYYIILMNIYCLFCKSASCFQLSSFYVILKNNLGQLSDTGVSCQQFVYNFFRKM